MKKITIHLFLITVITFGVFSLTPSANAQSDTELQTKINLLLNRINELKLKLNQQQNNKQCLNLNRTLSLGSSNFGTGGEVTMLQYFLLVSGYYTNNITGKYDLNTKNAVIAYQNANNINGLEKTYGMVGYKTRNAINQSCLTTRPIAQTGYDSWINFISQKDNFEVKFPTQPKETELSFYKFSTELNSLSNPKMYLSEKDNASYAVALQKYDKKFFVNNGSTKIINDTMNNLLKSNNLKLLNKKITLFDSQPAIEFTARQIQIQDASQIYTIKGRIIATNSHRYILAVTSDNIDEEKYNKFISSFTLMK